MSAPSRNLRSTARRQAQQQDNSPATTTMYSPPRTRASTRAQTQARSSNNNTQDTIQPPRRPRRAQRPPPSNPPQRPMAEPSTTSSAATAPRGPRKIIRTCRVTRPRRIQPRRNASSPIAEPSNAAPEAQQAQPNSVEVPSNAATINAGPQHDPGERVQDQSMPLASSDRSLRRDAEVMGGSRADPSNAEVESPSIPFGQAVAAVGLLSAPVTRAGDAAEDTIVQQAQPTVGPPPRLRPLISSIMMEQRVPGHQHAVRTRRNEDIEQYSLEEAEMALIRPPGRPSFRRRARNRFPDFDADSDSDSEYVTDEQRQEAHRRRHQITDEQREEAHRRRQQIQADYERSQAALRARREENYAALQSRARTFTLPSSTTPSALNATVQEGQKATRKLSQLAENACPICTDPFTEPTTTKCGHVFCKACVVQWMLEKGTCPSCRQRHRVEELVGIVTEREEESRANNAAIMRALDDMRAAGAEVIVMSGDMVDEDEL